MKKTLISLGIATAMVASGAAIADSKFYGHAQVEIASWGGDADGVSVEDNARGRIGFKASEDLGGGMKAIAKFEFKVDTADGDAGASGSGAGISLQKREMMVGLKTGMGTIEMGRLKSAYKYTGGVKYDPYVATVLEARGNGGMTGGAFGHNSFISDSIAYSNKMGAISFRLTYDLDDGGGEGVAAATGANAMSFAFKYATKKWEAFVAVVSDDGGATEYSSTKFGGQMKVMKGLKVSLQLEMAELKGTGDTDVTYLDVQYKLNKKDTVNFAFGTTDDPTAFDTDFIRLAYGHKFSKKTKGWVGYRSTDDGTAAPSTDTPISVGLQVRF